MGIPQHVKAICVDQLTLSVRWSPEVGSIFSEHGITSFTAHRPDSNSSRTLQVPPVSNLLLAAGQGPKRTLVLQLQPSMAAVDEMVQTGKP